MFKINTLLKNICNKTKRSITEKMKHLNSNRIFKSGVSTKKLNKIKSILVSKAKRSEDQIKAIPLLRRSLSRLKVE